ncbi:MAG: GntR family transcriptional regulator [Bacteroidales bacterium]|nr:GntR family transcriptional regulator [Bacteroidales bacterium]MCF8406055.1 GntR family transcriptional regulator [Bacteroidales bacterium]
MLETYDDNNIKENVKTPKYRQLMNLIISDIESGVFKVGEKVPSVTESSIKHLLARDTVEKAYKRLKSMGILTSTPCLGYYITNSFVTEKIKVCLLYNKLSNYKQKIYYAFTQTLGKDASVDLKIYNYNLSLFEKIVSENIDNYDYFVIIPHFLPGTTGIIEVIESIPSEKVLILDRKLPALNQEFATVHQDYEQDIVNALGEGYELLIKYKKINLVFPSDLFYARQIIHGFKIFCDTKNINYSILEKLEKKTLKKKQVYILTRDEDLVLFIKLCKSDNLVLGKDLGLIVYNEDPLKEIIANGITTISTNHEQIGIEAANLILLKEIKDVKIPFNLIMRSSL